MKRSIERILTTQAGSLPRPDDLIELNRARQKGESADEAAYQERLRVAVEDVVRRQKDAGVDIAGDGEFGKAMGQRVNYGAWWSYSFQRHRRHRLRPRRARPSPARVGEAAVARAGRCARHSTALR